MTRPEKILRELIALPSVNPAFLPLKHPNSGEKRVADFLATLGARAGLDVQWQTVLPQRSNLLLRLRPAGKVKKRILLAPHLDTIGAPEMSGSLFKPCLKIGRLFGRGACDTKGSVAAMFTALCQLAESKARPRHTEITFAGLIDEESGQAGSRALAASKFKADLAVVGEPTRLRLATTHKGVLWLRFETRGRAAHGARPELGRNAIHTMARIVDLLETSYARSLRARQHPLLVCPTVNVGSIHGGKQPNIVPDECVILVDRRTLPGENDAQVRRELASLLNAKKLSARITSIQQGPCSPLETSPHLGLVRDFLRTIKQNKPVGVDYFSDAGVLGAAGIPSVLFGPGDIAQAHTADEWISVAQLNRGTEMLGHFFKGLS